MKTRFYLAIAIGCGVRESKAPESKIQESEVQDSEVPDSESRDSETLDSDTPELKPPEWTALSSGFDHSCAVAVDGQIACWGTDNFHDTRAPEGLFKEVTAGSHHSCALTPEGQATCWDAKSLSDASADFGQATPPLGHFHGLAGGGLLSCALDDADQMVCWGKLFTGMKSPTGAFQQLSLGSELACALSKDGAISCWGDPAWTRLTPVYTDFTQVACGAHHCCALNQQGEATCWGGGDDGTTGVPDGLRFIQLSANWDYTCGVLASQDKIECWGPTIDDPYNLEIAIHDAPSGEKWIYSGIARSSGSVCGLTAGGHIWCEANDVPPPP